jgi:hypothetical protein
MPCQLPIGGLLEAVSFVASDCDSENESCPDNAPQCNCATGDQTCLSNGSGWTACN